MLPALQFCPPLRSCSPGAAVRLVVATVHRGSRCSEIWWLPRSGVRVARVFYQLQAGHWSAARTILPLQVLDMAAFDAGSDLTGLTHHSDHGSNHMALVYTDRIAELGAIPSTGTVGDSCDNAMAEAINPLDKAEPI